MTARQRECQKIAEAKARAKARRISVRRFIYACVFAVVLISLGGGFWFVRDGGISRTLTMAENRFFEWTAQSGFKVEHVYLEGRNHTAMEKIEQALQVKSGTPILAQSPREMRDRLEALDRVQTAEVERILPSTLHIHIIEREPIAIWQNQGALRLIDNTGRIMEDVSVAAYSHLPIVIGENAPSHAPELFTMMAQDPALLKQVSAAIRVSERRWNLRFKNGIEVKMPERDANAAWQMLETMQARDDIMGKAILAIDFRLAGKVFLQTAPVEGETGGASVTPVKARGATLSSNAHET